MHIQMIDGGARNSALRLALRSAIVAVALVLAQAAAAHAQQGGTRYVPQDTAVARLAAAGVYDWCYNDAGKIPMLGEFATMDKVTYQQVLEQAHRELTAANVPAKAIQSAFCGVVEPGLPAWLAKVVWPHIANTAKSRTADTEIEIWTYHPKERGGTASLVTVTVVNGVVHDVTTVQ